MKAKSFLSGATPFQGSGGSEPPPLPMVNDKAWMSEKRLQPGAGGTPAVVKEFDGKRVRIGGYVVPLDFEATNVKEFLLVPFVGACIHVPPPPANQIIYVKAVKGFDVAGSFDPVYVTGTLKVASAYTGLAETGYSHSFLSIARRTPRCSNRGALIPARLRDIPCPRMETPRGKLTALAPEINRRPLPL
jgi:hypothetical protein